MIYNVHIKQVYNCFQKVVHWMNVTFSYPFVKALQEEDRAFLKNYQMLFLVIWVVSIQDVLVLLMSWLFESNVHQ